MRLFLLPLLILLNGPAWADEYYQFYRIRCVSNIPSIEIDRVGYWNIRNIVWPGNLGWKEHVASLKRLEKDAGLYVFDEWYGYADKSPLVFACGPAKATVTYSIAYREKGPVGSNEPVRMQSRVTITTNGKDLISNIQLGTLKHLRAYSYGEGDGYIDICTEDGCADTTTEITGTLTWEKLDRLLTK